MNVKREKAVEKEVMAMAQEIGLDLSVIDSSAKYSKTLERYREGVTESGFSDLCGNDQEGRAVFVELKAPGKLRAIRAEQIRFLERKARSGCFAVCVDSGQLLFDLYVQWKIEGSQSLFRHLDSLK